MQPAPPIAQSTLPPRGYTAADTEGRRAWLAQRTGVQLEDLPPDAPEQLKGIIENHVGQVRLPLAVAGPLVVNGSYAEGTYYVPLCTVEGTLAISMTRGAYLTSLCGGITDTAHLKQEVSRSPVFVFPDVDACQPFLAWVEAEMARDPGGGRVHHPARPIDFGSTSTSCTTAWCSTSSTTRPRPPARTW